MSTILEEFWIFSKDEIPYVNFFRDITSNYQFDSRLFNSDDQIAKKVESVLESEEHEFSKKNLIFFEYEKSRYMIIPCLNKYLRLVLKSALDMKIKKIHSISKIICGMIKSLYMVMDFRKWKGDLKMFDILKKKIDLYFKMSNL